MKYIFKDVFNYFDLLSFIVIVSLIPQSYWFLLLSVPLAIISTFGTEKFCKPKLRDGWHD